MIVGSRAAVGQTTRPAEATLDVGGALLQQPGLAATNVLTAAGQLRYAAPIFAFSANGVGARTPDDRFTGQGVLTGSLYAAPARRVRWELTGTGSAFGLSNAAPAFAWQGVAREHLTGSLGGAFVGVAGGEVSTSGVLRTIGIAQTGGYLRLDPLGRDELSVAATFTNSTARDSIGRIRYTDAIGYWTHRSPGVELNAGGGLRVNVLGSPRGESWGSASAALWMTDRAAIVVAAGRALPDISRGIPSVRYLSLSVRLAARTSVPALSIHVRHDRPDDGDGRLDVRQMDDSSRVVSVRLPLATSVEMMADFTDWEAVPLTRMPNGDWQLERPIASGTHHVAIRVDGGKWIIPPNLPRVQDEFGGEVGIVIVP